MKRGRASEPARRGFTLVELLVVIAIITILMSLLLAAVMRSVIKTEEVQTRNDISQLEQAISSFKVKYNVEAPPSRLVFGRQQSDFTAFGKLGADSLAYINRVWPRINWNGNHSGWPKPGLLEGHQCLVFFLGGPPVGPNGAPAGFSTNPTDPFSPPTAGEQRVTFYDFPVNRLSVQAGFFSLGSKSTFPCFLDAYKKQPYAYFSSYKTQNGYNRYWSSGAGNGGWAKQTSDCVSLKVWPYAETVTPSATPIVNYLNPNGFQIISAGRDKVFGRGYVPNDSATLWTAKNPLTKALISLDNTVSTAGNDDMSNFHDRLLGIPAN